MAEHPFFWLRLAAGAISDGTPIPCRIPTRRRLRDVAVIRSPYRSYSRRGIATARLAPPQRHWLLGLAHQGLTEARLTIPQEIRRKISARARRLQGITPAQRGSSPGENNPRCQGTRVWRKIARHIPLMHRLGAIRASREEIQELRALVGEQKVVILKPFLGAEDAGARAVSRDHGWCPPCSGDQSSPLRILSVWRGSHARLPLWRSASRGKGERMVAVSDGRVQWDDA